MDENASGEYLPSEHARRGILADGGESMPLPKYERFALRPGPVWDSVGDLLQSGEESLESVGSGAVATLSSPVGRFRLLSEDDFQALYGMAQDARRVAAELSSVLRAVRERPDAGPAESLSATVVELAENLEALPVRTGHEPLEPEGLDVDESDLDLVLDSARL